MKRMICPTCSSDLKQTKIKGGGLAYVCPLKHGMALSQLLLRKLLPNRLGIKMWSGAMRAPNTNGKACPSCSNKMINYSSERFTKNIELDICKSCSFFWFDKQEYTKIFKFSQDNSSEHTNISQLKKSESFQNKKDIAIAETQKMDDTLTLNDDFQKAFNASPFAIAAILTLIGLGIVFVYGMKHPEVKNAFLYTNYIKILGAAGFIYFHQLIPNILKHGIIATVYFDKSVIRYMEIIAYWLSWLTLIGQPLYILSVMFR